MAKINEICFIDDDPIQIFLLNKFVQKLGAGYKTTSFSNGKLAFNEMLKRVQESGVLPGIIFLDLNMPVWDGWDFYDAFSRLYGYDVSKVFILTSSLSEDDQKRLHYLV
ncbi:MAG: response regulator [Balneolales bacterium]|nr:response regulator [Balneolales bacterium]